jgi:hypothetical protein
MAEVQRRLGTLYRTLGLIDQERLEQALAMQQAQGIRLGRFLAESGGFDERSATQLVSERLKLDAVDPAKLSIDEDVLAAVPETMAKELCILPVSFDDSSEGTVMTCATSDPLDPVVLSKIRAQIGGFRIRWVLAGEQVLQEAIERHYASLNGKEDLHAEVPNFATPGVRDEVLADFAGEDVIESASDFDAALGEVLEDYIPDPMVPLPEQEDLILLTDAYDSVPEPDTAERIALHPAKDTKSAPGATAASHDLLTSGLGWGALLARDDDSGIEASTAGVPEVYGLLPEEEDGDSRASMVVDSPPTGPQANEIEHSFESESIGPAESESTKMSEGTSNGNLPWSFEHTESERAYASSEPKMTIWSSPGIAMAQIALKPIAYSDRMQEDLLLPEVEAEAVADAPEPPDERSFSRLHSIASLDSDAGSLFRRFVAGESATEEERTKILREVVRVMLEQRLL